jgi:hypothetical protein
VEQAYVLLLTYICDIIKVVVILIKNKAKVTVDQEQKHLGFFIKSNFFF